MLLNFKTEHWGGSYSQSDVHGVILQKMPRVINLVQKCACRRNFSDSYVVDINERQIKLVMYNKICTAKNAIGDQHFGEIPGCGLH